MEDSRRNMRYLEHQFAIVKGIFQFLLSIRGMGLEVNFNAVHCPWKSNGITGFVTL